MKCTALKAREGITGEVTPSQSTFLPVDTQLLPSGEVILVTEVRP